MTKKSQNVQLGLLLQSVKDGEYLHLYAHVVHIRPGGKVRNDVDVWGPFNGGLRRVKDLMVVSQGERKDPGRLYGYDVEYRNVFSVDREDAERIRTTLRIVNRKLDRMSIGRGYPRTYGEYLGRVAEALGKDTKFVVATDEPRGGWSHDDNTYRFMDIGDGVYYVDHKMIPALWPTQPRETEAADAAKEADSERETV